jgi:hypothetical protein
MDAGNRRVAHGSFLADTDSHRALAVVGQAQVHAAAAQFALRTIAEHVIRLAAGLLRHADFIALIAHLRGLEERLARGEASCQVLIRRVDPASAALAFQLCEHALGEARAGPRADLGHARDLDAVDADTGNHRGDCS